MSDTLYLSAQSFKVRRPKAEDASIVEGIASAYKDNPLPSTWETAAVCEKEEEVIAFGVLRSNVEILLYTDGTPREKTIAMRNLMEIAKDDAKRLGHKFIYVFAQDEQFAKILEKHFGFRRTDGVPLILDLE